MDCVSIRTCLLMAMIDPKHYSDILGGDKLRAVLVKGPGELVIEDVPIPEISEDEVLVEVKYSGICGSDVRSLADCLLYQPGTYMGHEFSGIINKVGKHVKGLKVGDRVTANPLFICNECYACKHGRQSQCEHGFEHAIGCVPGLEHAGAWAKYVRVPIPERRLYRIPKEVSFEEGALVEPLACSLHAVKVSGFSSGEHAMVLGAGPIGLGIIAHRKNTGAGLIIVTEIRPRRVELAKKLGADYVFNPQEEPDLKDKVSLLTNGKGIDVVFDCSGNPLVFQSATDFLRKGGLVLLSGIIEQETPIIPMNWVLNEWRLQGSMCYYADEYPMVIDFLKKGISPVKEMITSKVKLSDIVNKGFDVLADPNNNEIKILVEPDE